MVVQGIEVKVEDLLDVTEAEAEHYIDYIEGETHGALKTLSISRAEDDSVTLSYELKPQKFERIRRITGYLVGTIDRWNDSKRAEEHERVKHCVA